jgi:hypothetical protein
VRGDDGDRFISDQMEAYLVDPHVNNAKNQGPKCIEAMEA